MPAATRLPCGYGGQALVCRCCCIYGALLVQLRSISATDVHIVVNSILATSSQRTSSLVSCRLHHLPNHHKMLYELIGVVRTSLFNPPIPSPNEFFSNRSAPAATSPRSKKSQRQPATSFFNPAASYEASPTGAHSFYPSQPVSRAPHTTRATTLSCDSTRAREHSMP